MIATYIPTSIDSRTSDSAMLLAIRPALAGYGESWGSLLTLVPEVVACSQRLEEPRHCISLSQCLENKLRGSKVQPASGDVMMNGHELTSPFGPAAPSSLSYVCIPLLLSPSPPNITSLLLVPDYCTTPSAHRSQHSQLLHLTATPTPTMSAEVQEQPSLTKVDSAIDDAPASPSESKPRHRRTSSTVSGVFNINDLGMSYPVSSSARADNTAAETEGVELKIAPETQKLNW